MFSTQISTQISTQLVSKVSKLDSPKIHLYSWYIVKNEFNLQDNKYNIILRVFIKDKKLNKAKLLFYYVMFVILFFFFAIN